MISAGWKIEYGAAEPNIGDVLKLLNELDYEVRNINVGSAQALINTYVLLETENDVGVRDSV